MSDRATGPVKPPVIDLTARTGARPEAEPHSSAGEAAPGISHRNDNPPRPPSPAIAWPLLGAAAVGGALLGTLLTYLLATAVPLPSRTPVPDLSADVAAQGTQLSSLATSVADLKTSTARTQMSLDATIAQLDAALADIKKSVADVAASVPAAQPAVDLTPLEGEIKTLKAQIEAIAAGASGADAGAIAQSLANAEAGIASLTTRLNGVDSTVSALRTDLDGARKALTDHIDAASATEVGPALKLPLILSGLESAFATGGAYDAELTTLTAIMPGVAVPDAVTAAAQTGLSRPDQLETRFEAALPAILSARDTAGTDWTTAAVDWAKSLLALRPAEEVDGDSPDAIVSRIEGAMTRRDYGHAAELIASLPAPMRDAAAPVASDIAAHAAADGFVTELRAKALASTGAAK